MTAKITLKNKTKKEISFNQQNKSIFFIVKKREVIKKKKKKNRIMGRRGFMREGRNMQIQQ